MSLSKDAGGLVFVLASGYLSSTTQPVLGMDPSIALAGLIGSAITILLQRGIDARETLAIAVCGSAAAIYMTSIVARWVGANDNDALRLIGVVLGVGGVYIFRRIVDLLRDPGHVAAAIKAGKWSDLFLPSPRQSEPPTDPK